MTGIFTRPGRCSFKTLREISKDDLTTLALHDLAPHAQLEAQLRVISGTVKSYLIYLLCSSSVSNNLIKYNYWVVIKL